MPDVLTVSHLVKEFGSRKDRFTAVDDISFSLKEGEILGILGPNGAGKTTSIQMLFGALTPTSGSIKYFGKEFQDHREEILEQVNFSTTYINLPWLLTVKENLTFISFLYSIPDRKKRIEQIIEIFRLQDLLKLSMNQLSAGQSTRVNLAKALLNHPKILLLDEPTASLDPEVAKYIREFLLEERQKFKMSIIFTSHNMAEVEEMCDRIIFINHGKVVADDTPENLAKTIELSHVHLRFNQHLNQAISHIEELKLGYEKEGKLLRIDINEKQIPEFLRGLMDKNIVYSEISIDKPTLEDYFLEMAKTK